MTTCWSSKKYTLFVILLLYFFVEFVHSTPFAKLLELNFVLNLFFVSCAPIVNAFAFPTRKFNKMVLAHSVYEN